MCILRPMRLRITETFLSIQGESSFTGLPCVFIRLTGCDLRCSWCDSTYTFTGGEWRTLDALVSETLAFGAPMVCVTGGEPLLQKPVSALVERLLDAGLVVTVETGGHRDIGVLDARAHRIVDLKPPASGQVQTNRWENIALLTQRDEIKCVIADRADYEWVRGRIAEHGLEDRVAEILLSPVHGRMDAATLIGWMLEDKLRARFQLQAHKVVWGAEATGV